LVSSTYDFRSTLLRKEEMLVASLSGLKDVLQHRGGRGSVGESEWRDVIEEFLASRYCVAGNTEVIDHKGNTTEQQEIVK
jgi:DNA anti-recombination protein RmuC